MADLTNLPCHSDDGEIHVVVEAPRGSLVKLKYDPEKKVFLFHRALPLGIVYPYDFGFVPSTRAEDGDSLDAMVLFDAPTWPGVVIASRAIGVVRMTQKEKGGRTRNDRIIAVPTDDDRYDDVRDLPKRMRKQLEQFFLLVNAGSDKAAKIDGWESAKAAKHLIKKAAMAYVKGGK